MKANRMHVFSIGQGIEIEFVDGVIRIDDGHDEIHLGPDELDKLLELARRYEFSPETSP